MSRKCRYQGHYAASGRPKFHWWILSAAVLLVVAASVIWFQKGKKPQLEDGKAPPASTPAATAPVETRANSQENLYREILQQYAAAIEEEWTVEQLAPTDLGPKIANYDGYDGLGYSLMDINGDSSDELIITDGSSIYALYSIVDGEVQPQWLGHENMECWLCEDDVLVEVHEGMGWLYSFMKLGQAVLEPFYTMTYAPEKDADNPWFQGNPYTEPDTLSLDGGEAVARLQSYQQVYIRNTPFRLGIDGVSRDDYVPDDPEIYQPAIREMQENYIFAEPMTYTFYDMDADGQRELLLGSGNAIRRMVKMKNGQAVTSLFSGEQRYVYLCDGGIMWDSSLRGHWFTDMDGNVVEFVYYREETDSWYMKNKEKSPDVYPLTRPRQRRYWIPLPAHIWTGNPLQSILWHDSKPPS